MTALLIITDSQRRLLHASLSTPVPAMAPGTEWREFCSATTLCGLEITAPASSLATHGVPADVTCPECRIAAKTGRAAFSTGRNSAARRPAETKTITFRKKA